MTILFNKSTDTVSTEVVINPSETPSPKRIKMLEEFFGVSFSKEVMEQDVLTSIAYGY